MTAPTPAAVRAAMKPTDEWTQEEADAIYESDGYASLILRDHIRAIAAEMRARAKRAESCREYCEACALENFADKLEGRES